MKKTPNLRKWWGQFPQRLQLITRGRFVASIGAGGVLYMTPLVFNVLDFSASQIGRGLTFAAIAGTITRLITGNFLDKGINFTLPLKLAALFALIADSILFKASTYSMFIYGEIFLGAAAGIYWPSVELAIPISCDNFPSNKGFALARSADALGVSIGALIGSIAASINYISFVYIVEIICMISFLFLLENHNLKRDLKRNINKKINQSLISKIMTRNLWSPQIVSILLVSILATGILSLMQSALPLDLVKGGIYRKALDEGLIGMLIAIQLTLLLAIQWPIGNWLTQKDIRYGLKLSLLSFTLGTLFLSISSFITHGLFLIFISLVPMSIGLAAFLPTATEAIVKVSPIEHRGIAMALYSQTFGISALTAPLIAGYMIDTHGNACLLWFFTSLVCILMLPIIKKVKETN